MPTRPRPDSEAINPSDRGSVLPAREEVSFVGLARIVAGEWRLVAAVVALVLVGAVVYTLRQEPVYQASSVVQVRTQHARMAQGTLDEVLNSGGTNRTIINEVALLQQSVPLAEQVAAALLEAGHAGPLTASSEQSAPSVPWIARQVLFGRRVQFGPVSDFADLIQIVTTSTDPQEAALLANLYADAYLARSRDMSRASIASSRSFLESQEASQRAELDAAERALEAFMTHEGALALESEGQRAVLQVAELDSQAEQARLEIEIERTALRELEQEVERVMPGLTRRIASGVEAELRGVQEELARYELLAGDYYAVDPTLRGDERRNPELAAIHTRVVALRGRVETLAEQFKQEVLAVGGVDQSTGNTGLGWVTELQRRIVEKRIALQALEARQSVLRQQAGRYEERLRTIPGQAIRLAQLQRERQAAERTWAFLTERLQEAQVAEQAELGFVQVVRRADPPGRPVRPRPLLNVLVALTLGLGVGVALALGRRTIDRRVFEREDVAAAGFALLGTVPDFRALVRRNFGREEVVRLGGRSVHVSIATALHPLSPLTEALRTLRTSLRFSLPDRSMQVILVTSPNPGEGKSTVAATLALSHAQAGRRTLYVDADLRRPTGHTLLGLGREGGLSELLFRKAPVDWSAHRYALSLDWPDFQDTVEGFYVLTAGQAVPNPAELLGSQRLRDLVAEMRGHFDTVVIDAPPVLAVSDPILLAACADAAVVVAVAGGTRLQALARVRERLAVTGTAVAGLVLNRASRQTAGREGYGYGYGYGTRDRFLPTGDGTPASLPTLRVSS